MVLVGNKTDLDSTRRAVTYLEGRYSHLMMQSLALATLKCALAHSRPTRLRSQKAGELGMLFCECSAKTGEGVANVFHHFVWVLTSWQHVEHMATPAHVPSEALLAQLFPHTGTTTTPAGCALQ